MQKIYGIDLGTTNSLLGLDGKLLTGLVPSVVNLKTGVTGSKAKHDIDAARSFKCDISLSAEGALSVAASTHVLSQLVKESGEDVRDVVISVPAYFSEVQRQATIEAAKRAHLNVVSLINEPTAAAIYAASKRNSLSVVFDLGGGTFDVSIIDSRFGDYDVQATDGCILGGDNFDAAIRNWAVKEGHIRMHMVNAQDLIRLQWECTNLKVRLQKSQQPERLDLSSYGAGSVTLTPEIYQQIMMATFYETIVKTKKVIAESIPVDEPYEIILVGGSTRCPYLREWIKKELNHDVMELFYDPDRIVAQGASIYATMYGDGTAREKVSDVTKALSIGLANGMVETVIEQNSKIPVQESIVAYNHDKSSQLMLELYQGENIIAANNECIGTLIYDYGREVEAKEGLVDIVVNVKEDGTIDLSCKEIGKEPQSITLMRK